MTEWRAALGVRLWSLMIVALLIAPLGVAVWLRPDERGFGTHQQLGLSPCGMLLLSGYPCPTCGMTTSFAHTVRGQWVRAAHAQPGGFALALACAGFALVALRSVFTGRVPMRLLLWLTPMRIVVILLVLLFGGWIYKLLVGHIDGSLPLPQVKFR